MKHYMKLHSDPFHRIASGKKKIELRLYDEKRRLICIGDKIEFTNLGNAYEKVTVDVVALRRFDSFEELYKVIPIEMHGYDEDTAKTASYTDMLKYYSEEQQKRYGVLGIEIRKCQDD